MGIRITMNELAAMRGVDREALAEVFRAAEAVSTTYHPVPSRTASRVPGTWVVTIDGWHPPTVNALMRGHWSKRARIKKNAVHRIVLACREIGVPVAQGRRKVLITVSVPNMSRQPDPDNVPKCLLDGLSTYGALIDDQAKYVDCPTPVIVKGPKSTTLVISDIP